MSFDDFLYLVFLMIFAPIWWIYCPLILSYLFDE